MTYYLDNAATSWPKPESVYKTLDGAFRQMFSPKRGTAKAARQGAELLMTARRTVASFFNIPDPMRVIFTTGCTHALNLAVQAFPWQPDDGVVISAVEHHALSRPVRKMAREKGIRFFVVPYQDENPFDLAALESLLQTEPNIRLVATTHASNVIGSVLPVAEIAGLAHQYGALYLLDAAQSAGVLPLDVQALGVDMMAVPGHKSLYGPPGVGALYAGESVSLNTFMEGGTGNDSGKHPMSPTIPESFEVGTISLPLILAFAEGIRWVQETGVEAIHRHETALLSQILQGLQSLPEIKIYGHADVTQKTPVVSFNLPGTDPKQLGHTLFDQHGIALRAGFHCAPMAHEAISTLPLGGTVRASLGYFTRPEDIGALLLALKTELQKSPATVQGYMA